MRNFIRLSIVLYFLLFGESLLAQSKILNIQVFEEETAEPLAFANIYWGNSSNGFLTRFDGKGAYIGNYFPDDTIEVVYGGYVKKRIAIDTTKKRIDLIVHLQRELIRAKELSIRLGINPALKWIQLAQQNSEKNNPDNAPNYQCNMFTKTTFSLNKLGRNVEKMKVGKELGLLFDTLVSITGDSNKAILPVFLSHTFSEYSHQQKPLSEHEKIIASRVKGVGVDNGGFISQLTGSVFIKYNIYKPTLQVLGKGVNSPIANNAERIYNYKLVNVDKSGPLRVFQIYCSPKNEQDILFYGMIWIQEKTGAILRLNLEIHGDANINFLDRLRITQENDLFNDSFYLLTNSRVMLDIAEINKTAGGVIATNNIQVSNYSLIPEFEKNHFRQRISIDPRATEKSDSFWNSLPESTLSQTEKKIIDKIDTVKGIPSINKGVRIVNFLVDGYISKDGYLEFGPYYLLGSINRLEGIRNRVGFRTTNAFSEKVQLETYLAYGYRDKRFKYGGKFIWNIDLDNGTVVKLFRSLDVELLGFSDNDAVSSGDALITALNMFASRSVTYCNTSQLLFQSDVARGLNLSLRLSQRSYNLPQTQTFELGWYDSFPVSKNVAHRLNNTTATFKIEYEPKVFYLIRNNRRKRISPPGPKYTFSYLQAFPNVLGSMLKYSRIGAQYDNRIIWGTAGKTVVKISAAQVIGNVPYPVLNIPLGNQAPVYNKRAFNQMRLFEFVSDKSIEAGIEHHFNGLLFNRIPQLKKLKWRELVHIKGIYGTLKQENANLIPREILIQKGVNPIRAFDKLPYLEAGVGIENIFKYIRVDGVWRLTYRDNASAQNFGLKISFYIGF